MGQAKPWPSEPVRTPAWESPSGFRYLPGIATPVCGPVRNDGLFQPAFSVYLLFLTKADIFLVSLGFLLALLGPADLLIQDFQDLDGLFRLGQRLDEGLGHGGIESVMVVGMTYVNNFIIAVMVQSGKMAESLATLEQAEAEQTVRNLEPLWTLTADQFFLPGVERVLALAMQVAFSLLVYRSVKDKKIGFLGLSLLCHFLMTFLSSLAGAILGGIAAEACNLALTAVICGLAWKLVWQPEIGVENPDDL